MANHKSAEKRARQTKRRTLVNKTKKSRATTMTKKLHQAISEGNKDLSTELLCKVQSLLAKLKKTGTLKENTASRRVSRLALKVGKL